MKKLFSALLVVLLIFSLAITGCAKDDAKETEDNTQAEANAPEGEAKKEDFSNENYYYICPLGGLEYWLQHKAGLEDACYELGVNPVFSSDTESDVTKMVALLENAINDPDCRGIITQANYAEAYEPYVKQAKEKGIPVCFQTIEGVEGSERLCFIGTDYIEYGRIMLRQAAEATNEKGGIIVSNALSSGSVAIQNIMTGIRDEVTKYPDMSIVAEVDDKSDASEAATKISAALVANPDVTAIIGGQSTSAIGAVTALKEAGREPGEVKVISIDRDLATLEFIESGDIYSTVAGKQYTEVYYGVKLCYDYNHGSKNAFSNDDDVAQMVIAPDYMDTGALIINKDNVEYFLNYNYADRVSDIIK